MSEEHPRAAAIVAAVRACVGTRFRAQGRLPGVGLDCVGVALVGMAAAGMPSSPVAAYALSGDGLGFRLRDWLGKARCKQMMHAAPGDLIVFAVARDQPHLAILTKGAVVHADLGLRAVVEGPPRAVWPVQSVWRFATGD